MRVILACTVPARSRAPSKTSSSAVVLVNTRDVSAIEKVGGSELTSN